MTKPNKTQQNTKKVKLTARQLKAIPVMRGLLAACTLTTKSAE